MSCTEEASNQPSCTDGEDTKVVGDIEAVGDCSLESPDYAHTNPAPSRPNKQPSKKPRTSKPPRAIPIASHPKSADTPSGSAGKNNTAALVFRFYFIDFSRTKLDSIAL